MYAVISASWLCLSGTGTTSDADPAPVWDQQYHHLLRPCVFEATSMLFEVSLRAYFHTLFACLSGGNCLESAALTASVPAELPRGCLVALRGTFGLILKANVVVGKC